MPYASACGRIAAQLRLLTTCAAARDVRTRELFGLSNDDATRSYPYTLADVFASGVAAVVSGTSTRRGV